jgi:uncharacterized protein YceK
MHTMKAILTALLIAAFCSGCTVITIAGAAVGTAATVASTSVDVAVGTAKVGAKVVGAAADVLLPSSDNDKK